MLRNPRQLHVEQLEARRLFALNPTGAEQELMQLVNRFRTDPQGEFSRLIAVASPIKARDPSLQVDLDFANVNGNTLRSELQALSPVAPVAWNEAIRSFAAGHNVEMINANPPAHFHSNTLARRQALLDAGVNLRFATGEKINAENVYGFGKSTVHVFASYVIDWQQGGPGGMGAGRRHRAAVGNPDFEQAGHAITPFGGSNFGPLVNTQVLANIESPPIMVTGAIFEDKNNSQWYEAGEGIGSVSFVFQGAAGTFTTVGYATGGYQIELPPGTYSATATGGGMKFPQRIGNIVVGGVNVWKNFIYDPDVIPPDTLEPNNAISAATALSGAKQSFSSLSIHIPSDVDYFRLDPRGNGQLKADLQFVGSSGNLDLRLLNSAGALIAESAGTGNTESIVANVVRGTTYYIQVLGSSGATNGSYSLNIDPPQSAAPVAGSDRAIFNDASGPIVIDVLANDSDPDGDATKLVPHLAAGHPPAFTLTAQNSVQYVAPVGYSGVHRADYTVIDDQGLESAVARIAVFVIDFSDPSPWHNSQSGVDVNDDGVATPLDALLVINDLNTRQSRLLPTNAAGAAEIFGFVDVSGDGFVTPLDALLVINQINGDG